MEEVLADVVAASVERQGPADGQGTFRGPGSCSAHWTLLHAGREVALWSDARRLRSEQALVDSHPARDMPDGRAWLCLALAQAVASRVPTKSLCEKWKKTLAKSVRSHLQELLNEENGGSHSSSLVAAMLLKLAGEGNVALEKELVARAPLSASAAEMPNSADFIFLPAVLSIMGEPVECDFAAAARALIARVDEDPRGVVLENYHLVGAAVTAMWGLACSSSFKSRAAFEDMMVWIIEKRPDLWRDGSELLSHWIPQFLVFGIYLAGRKRLVTHGVTKLADLVHVDAEKTTLLCPLCGCFIGRGHAGDDASCKLHLAARQMVQSHNDAAVAIAAKESFQLALDSLWFDDLDKTELIDVVCAVAGLSDVRVVSMEEVMRARQTSKVIFDSTSLEAFSAWMRDKFARVSQNPTFRFRCAMDVRNAWLTHGEEGRRLQNALLRARECAMEPQKELDRLRALRESKQRAISGLTSFLRSSADGQSDTARVQKIQDYADALAQVEQNIAEFEDSCDEFGALAAAESDWAAFLEHSGLGKALDELHEYNAQVDKVRTGKIGKEGLRFEQECLTLVRAKFEGCTILHNITLRGVSFPERATSEFDFWVCKGNKVLEMIEMKRSSSAVRGNLLKKMSSIRYLLSSEFQGCSYQGMELTRDSFASFEGDGFYEHMWFYAREPVVVSMNEDVFGMFMDNEDAFLTSIMEVLQAELMSDEFLRQAYEMVKEKYPITAEDLREYEEGTAAFCRSVEAGRLLLVKHQLQPQDFNLPLRHKSSVATPGALRKQ